MQGICGALSSDLVANWVGAIGSAGAAIVAVSVYLIDRSAGRARAAADLENSRRRQALHIGVLLDEIWARLQFLQSTVRANNHNHPSVDDVLLPSPIRILDAVVDVAAFNTHELESTYSFVSVVNHLNHLVDKNCQRVTGGIIFILPPNQAEFVDRCLDACESLRRSMWHAGGVSAADEDDPAPEAA